MQIERGLLTVHNQTGDDWKDVEIWLNHSFRATTRTIPAGSRFQVPLNAFVTGYGQRFDSRHTMADALRLTAKGANDATVTLDKRFEGSGLAALGGKRP
jgi:hypothetical protein